MRNFQIIGLFLFSLLLSSCNEDVQNEAQSDLKLDNPSPIIQRREFSSLEDLRLKFSSLERINFANLGTTNFSKEESKEGIPDNNSYIIIDGQQFLLPFVYCYNPIIGLDNADDHEEEESTIFLAANFNLENFRLQKFPSNATVLYIQLNNRRFDIIGIRNSDFFSFAIYNFQGLLSETYNSDDFSDIPSVAFENASIESSETQFLASDFPFLHSPECIEMLDEINNETYFQCIPENIVSSEIVLNCQFFTDPLR